MHNNTHTPSAAPDAVVSRFALTAAAIVFGAFVLFLLGVAIARDTLNSPLGPFTVGVWLLLIMHVLPVVLGIVHMSRAREATEEARS